ncbi:O-antigen ligase family protein [Pusillimonas caeni]|uniref:O-antigen ligase family protein n=1 Tax=Pusillimonas caeni TaxID=1348472 RepID=UPI001431FEA2|nr:O-antigen ligase family protein [Pusillimonas caeni]
MAGLTSTIVLFWLIDNVEARPLTPGVILTTYTSIMLLLGFISLYSLKWSLTSWPRMETAIKILVAGATFAGFLAAQTRTGLLGIPVFVLLGLVIFAGVKKPGRLLTLFFITITLTVATVASNDALRHRIVEGIEQVQACHGENSTLYSSMCIRLQLWRTAIDAGINHPWVGLGDGGKFIQYMKDVAVPKGLASQEVVDEYFGEPHNDLMLMLVGFGLPGVLGLLLIYLAPCTYFFPRLLNKEASSQARAAAAMGLAVCLSFLLFGLTETMFRRMNTIGFYTTMVALFMVLSEPRPSQQDKPAPPALP